jgi:hypothetical protein
VELDIALSSAAHIDELKPLWLQMLSYHRDLIGGEFPVRGVGAALLYDRVGFRPWTQALLASTSQA